MFLLQWFCYTRLTTVFSLSSSCAVADNLASVPHRCLFCIYGADLLIERSPRRHFILRRAGHCNDHVLPMNVNGWWTFITEWVNQSAVLSSVNGHSSITLFVTGSMSFITSGMHNYRSVDNLIPSNRFDLGGPFYHDVTCVAFVWIKNTGRIIFWAYKLSRHPCAHHYALAYTIICPNYWVCFMFSRSCIMCTVIVRFMDTHTFLKLIKCPHVCIVHENNEPI